VTQTNELADFGIIYFLGAMQDQVQAKLLKYLYPLTAPNHSKDFPVAVASSDYLMMRMRMVISVSEIMCLVIIPLPSQIFCTFLPFINWAILRWSWTFLFLPILWSQGKSNRACLISVLLVASG
jgi:hypothetical protein